MAVRLRMKRLGRRHRPFFRICAMDSRSPRDGKVIEELGTYDPMVRETDARAVLKGDRIAYWLGVGAEPSGKVAVLIKKYGSDGTHLEAQKAALERLSIRPAAPPPVKVELKGPEPEAPAEAESTESEEGEAAEAEPGESSEAAADESAAGSDSESKKEGEQAANDA